jgi:hypothetical protein
VLSHRITMSILVGAAFGLAFAGALVLLAVLQGHRPLAGLLAAAAVVGVLVGAPFGFLWVKEMRPVWEQSLSGPADLRTMIDSQWRRNHERARRSPWCWVRLPAAASILVFASSAVRAVSAKTASAVALNSLNAAVTAVFCLYVTALWRSPAPPWRRS